MEYTSSKLSTIDFILLLILKAEPGISGYQIDKIIDNREYRRWTGVGQSSVYVRLQALNKKGLISSNLARQNIGRGPLPTIHALTNQGDHILQISILKHLSSYNVNEALFDLSLSGIHFVANPDAQAALTQHLKQTAQAQQRLHQKLKHIDTLPLGAVWMLKRHIQKAAHHHTFINSFLKVLKQESQS